MIVETNSVKQGKQGTGMMSSNGKQTIHRHPEFFMQAEPKVRDLVVAKDPLSKEGEAFY